MITLVLDASSAMGSVAVLRGDAVVGTAETEMRQANREGLLPAVIDALATAGVQWSNVGRVVCGAGPGSFTSLRVAAGLVKGMASSRGLPLWAVSSLALVAGAVPRKDGAYLVMTDALRDERFVASYEVTSGSVSREIRPFRVISRSQVESLAREDAATVIGPEADGSVARAASLARISDSSGLLQRVELASWEPAYGRLAAAQSGELRAAVASA